MANKPKDYERAIKHLGKSKEYEWARKHLTGTALAGVIAALDEIPDHRVPRIQLDSQSLWIHVDAIPGPQLAVWLYTGDVYKVDANGAVDDDPIAPRKEG